MGGELRPPYTTPRNGSVDRVNVKYNGIMTCFAVTFIVEFMSDAIVPVAQLDRAAAF